MQLTPHRILRRAVACVLAAACSLLTHPAAARVEAASRVTMFREPSASNAGITVYHPQVDVAASVAEALAVTAGYEMDAVSGATPKMYGPDSGPDAVSGATTFSDLRQAARGGLSYQLGLVNLAGAYSYGWENDYRSHTVSVAGRGDFLERNFTAGLAYTRNFDSVCDANNRTAQGPLDFKALSAADHCFDSSFDDVITRAVSIDTFEPSLAWTVTPRLLLQIGGTLQIVEGFQSNPYRQVLIGNQRRAPQERLPEHRQRTAVFARVHVAIPELRAAVQAHGRAYRDTWDVQAATGELGFSKYLGSSLIASLRGRYHIQSAAIFYRVGRELVTLGPTGAYWTGDRELGPLRTLAGGAKLVYLRRPLLEARSFFEEIEIGVKADLMLYGLDPGAPNGDRKSALVTQAGATLRF